MRDIAGMQFGRLTVIRCCQSKNHKRYWECICACGNTCIIRQDQIITGKTKSCGCLSKDVKAESARLAKKRRDAKESLKQGKKQRHLLKANNPRLYRIWQGMKSRCYYPKNKCFNSYGARGIQICEEWKNSFSTFAIWALSHGYADDLTIDRIDVDGNYHPLNCRWITMKEQQKNKRKRLPVQEGGANGCADSAGEAKQQSGNPNMITRVTSYHPGRDLSNGGFCDG